jgi:hypothetical protein
VRWLRKYWPWLLLVAAAAALVWWNPGDIASGVVAAVADYLTQGARLSSSSEDASGRVVQDPEDLRQQASAVLGVDVDMDAYAGARMLRSEADAKIAARSARAKILRAHVAYNDAARSFGGSIYAAVTAGGSGFSAQGGRRYATSADPYENDLEVMSDVIASRIAGGPDEAQRCTKFVNTRGGFKVPQSWLDEGFAVVALEDNPESDLVFLRKGA